MADSKHLRIGLPAIGLVTSGTPNWTAHIVDANNDGVGFVFQAEVAEAITHIGFRYGVRAATPPTYTIGLEGVSASTGFPDGTYKTNGGNCSGTFTPPADTSWDGTWQWVALANTYTPTVGELLAITIRSSTTDAVNYSTFSHELSNTGGVFGLPYALRLTGGSWSLRTSMPVYGLRSASSRHGYIIPNFYSTRTASTVGHRVAAKINRPAGSGDTYQVAGFRCNASIAGATGKNPLAKIWSASSALTSVTLDSDIHGASASGSYRVVEVIFSSLQTLNYGTDYYVGFEVADATNGGVILYGIQAAAAADIADNDGGTICQLSNYNGSAWTDDATVRPMIEFIMADETEPAAAASGGIVIGG